MTPIPKTESRQEKLVRILSGMDRDCFVRIVRAVRDNGPVMFPGGRPMLLSAAARNEILAAALLVDPVIEVQS